MKKLYLSLIVAVAAIVTVLAIVITSPIKGKIKTSSQNIIAKSEESKETQSTTFSDEHSKELKELESVNPEMEEAGYTLPVYCYYLDMYYDYIALKNDSEELYEYNHSTKTFYAADCEYVKNNATPVQLEQLKKNNVLSSDRRAVLSALELLSQDAGRLTFEDVKAAFSELDAMTKSGKEVTAVVLAQMLDATAGAPDMVTKLNIGTIVLKYYVGGSDRQFVQISVTPSSDELWYVDWDNTNIEYYDHVEGFIMHCDGSVIEMP